MLQHLRNHARNWIIKIILILVALSFVFWGTSSIFNLFLDDETVISINNEDISLFYYQNVLTEERRRLQEQGEARDEFSRISEGDLQDLVLSQIINRTLVRQAATTDKITLSQQQIDQIIVNQAFFHQDGKFSERRYIETLRRSNFSPQSYREYILDNFRYETYLAAVKDATFYTPDMLSQYVDWQYQRRDYSYLRVPPAQFVIPADIPEQQLRNFYAENIQNYYESEYFKIKSITLTTDDVLDKITYGEEDIRNTYRDLYGYLYDNEQITVRHIFFESTDETDDTYMVQAAELKEQINNKDDFLRLVIEWSQDDLTKEDGGNLGTLAAAEMPPEFIQVIRAESPTISLFGPVRTPFGVHLLWVDNRSGVDAPEFQTVYDDLVSDYIYGQLDESLLTEAERLSDEIFVSGDLDRAANVTGYKVEVSDLIALDSQYVEGLGQEFIDELLVLQTDDVSNLIWLDNGNFMVFQLLEYLPDRLIPYDELVEELQTDYLLRQAGERLKPLLHNITNRLNQQHDLAMAIGLLDKQDELIWQQRETQQVDLTKDAIDSYALSLPVNNIPYTAYTQLADGDYVIVYLNEVIHQDYDNLDEYTQQLVRQGYLQKMQQDKQQWLLTNLNQQADIILNTEILSNL